MSKNTLMISSDDLIVFPVKRLQLQRADAVDDATSRLVTTVYETITEMTVVHALTFASAGLMHARMPA